MLIRSRMSWSATPQPLPVSAPCWSGRGGASLGGELSGQVKAMWFRGAHSDHLVETAVGEVLIRAPGRSRCRVGEPVSWHLHRVWVLPHSSRDVVPG